ncbi:MAG: hypothetical protein KAI29_27565 [Cyclobacteriaceae bacterium]|nr:hypothetical protein [Cyclobacteriaceae bacterium]
MAGSSSSWQDKKRYQVKQETFRENIHKLLRLELNKKMEHTESFSKITFEYNTGPIPPPFCHKYKIVILKSKHEKYQVDLNLEYYDRDEITEDEIFDEGFSLDDDYKWKGNLPQVWGHEIERNLKSANWKKRPGPGNDGSELIIRISQDNQSEVLQPSSTREWEIFIQEIIQAIFELSKKEAPLHISFLSGESKNHGEKVEFVFSFANRNVLLISSKNGQNPMDWKEGEKLLKYIFAFNYMPESGFEKIPEKPGDYISPGDGLWYELSSQKNDDIERAKKLVETLKSYMM